MSKQITITDFTGGLNTAETTTIADNQLSIAKNVSYNNQKILGVRRGIDNFGNEISGITGIKTIYFTRFSDTTRHLLCTAADKIYKYNETTSNWDTLKAGLTTGLDFSMITYRDIVYITNGTDNFMYYNGTTITEVPAVSKVKYLAVDKDVMYGCGSPGAGNSAIFLYTNAGDQLILADFAHFEYIDRTTEGIITSLNVFGGLPTVGTDRGVYIVNVFGTAVEVTKADYDGSVASNRSVVNVENDQLFMSDAGVYSLSQREGVAGSYRATSYSQPIQKEIDKVIDKSTVAAHYFTKTNNVYMSVNSGGSRNNKLFVYSVLTSNPTERKFVWTEYENINANDFTEYEDSDGDIHLLVANAFGGQVVEIETGFNDNGVEIRAEVKTKLFDFGSPEIFKTFAITDIGGLISEQETMTFMLDVDAVETSKSFTGEVYAVGDAAEDLPLGSEPLGEDPLGGGAVIEDGITLYPFIRRRYPYQHGHRIAVEVSSNSNNSAWKLTKLNLIIEAEPTDVLNNNFIS